MNWRRIVCWIIFVCLVLFVLAVGAPYILSRNAFAYSGPGLIRDALLIDLNGQPARNRTIRLYLRGNQPSLVATTDDLGIVHVKEGTHVDGVVGFQRFFPSLPDADKRIHPVFWECDPAKAPVVYTWWDYHATGSRPYVNWPTPEHPEVKISSSPPNTSPVSKKPSSVN